MDENQAQQQQPPEQRASTTPVEPPAFRPDESLIAETWDAPVSLPPEAIGPQAPAACAAKQPRPGRARRYGQRPWTSFRARYPSVPVFGQDML